MRKSKVRYWTLFCPKYWALAATGADSAAAASAAAASRADLRTKRDIGAPSTPTGCGLAELPCPESRAERKGPGAAPVAAQRLSSGRPDPAEPRQSTQLRGRPSLPRAI